MRRMELKLIWPLFVIELLLKIVALRDLGQRRPQEVRGRNRAIWLAVILFISTIGPVLYLAWGRDGEAS